MSILIFCLFLLNPSNEFSKCPDVRLHVIKNDFNGFLLFFICLRHEIRLDAVCFPQLSVFNINFFCIFSEDVVLEKYPKLFNCFFAAVVVSSS